MLHTSCKLPEALQSAENHRPQYMSNTLNLQSRELRIPLKFFANFMAYYSISHLLLRCSPSLGEGNQDSSENMTLLEVLVTCLLPRRTRAGLIALSLPMSGVRSERKNLFAHRIQKVFLSCCNKYCTPHVLVETGLKPSLGKSFKR